MKRIFRSPVVGLFFLAPLVAEFFLGDFPIYMLPLILPLALWYGAGAILIREVTRRIGRGWPTMLLLGLAFGVVEEGLLTMSLFNPNYADLRLLDPGYVSALGIGIPWTIYALTLHPLWSIAAPIALIEEAQPDKRTSPWLGRRGLIAAGVCFVVGAAFTFSVNYAAYRHFIASVAQLISSAVLAIVVITVALRLPRTRAGQPNVSTPSAWIAFAITMICAGAYQSGAHSDTAWVAVSVMLVALAALAAGVARWSRSAQWGARHRFAVAAGLVLTYSWRAFFFGYGHGIADLVISLISYVVYAVAAVVILRICIRKISTPTSAKQCDKAQSVLAS